MNADYWNPEDFFNSIFDGHIPPSDIIMATSEYDRCVFQVQKNFSRQDAKDVTLSTEFYLYGPFGSIRIRREPKDK